MKFQTAPNLNITVNLENYDVPSNYQTYSSFPYWSIASLRAVESQLHPLLYAQGPGASIHEIFTFFLNVPLRV